MSEKDHINLTHFLRQYESESTRNSYKTGLFLFFKSVYPENESDLDSQAEKYLHEKRNYRDDIMLFKESLRDKAPKTIGSRLNAVKIFLEENGINFSKRFFKNMNGKVNQAITEERVPSNQELRRIIEHLPLQGKALSLVLSSSGLRIGEAVQLRLTDIETNRKPAKIKIRAEYTKTGKRRITFISPEAGESVEEWLKYRDQYVKQANARSFIYKRQEDDKLFPFSPTNFNVMWKNALTKAQLLEIDKKTNRVTMRPYNLRKFFRLRVGRYGGDEAEAMMGYQTGLNAIYARFDDAEERLEEVYRRSISDLSIYKRAVQVVQLDEEMKNIVRNLEDQVNALVHSGLAKDAKITYLTVNDEKKTREIDQLMLNNNRLNKKVADLERDLQSWKMTVQDFDKIIQHLISENSKLTVDDE